MDSIPDIHIRSRTAAASFSDTGEKISAGKQKGRVKLMGDIGDNKTEIAAKKTLIKPNMSLLDRVRNHFRATRYVNYGQVDLNINSLSKRLHISKADIREAQKSGGIKDLVSKRQEEKLDKALNHYEKLFKISQRLETKGLTHKMLMNATKKGLQLLLNAEKKSDQLIHFRVDTHLENVKHHFTIVVHPDLNDLNISHLGRRLGTGAFGAVTAEFRLDKPNLKTALKKATGASEEMRISNETELKNEQAMLSKIKSTKNLHLDANGNAVGIPKPPTLFTKVYGTKETVALRMERYDGNLSKASKASMKDKVEIAQQLLAGGANLEKANVFHADIKPGNILVRQEANGKWTAHISDFGSTVNTTDVEREHTVSDKRYVPNELVSNFDNNALAARDRFAMGMSIFSLFTSDAPSRAFTHIDNGKSGVVVDLGFVEMELAKAKVPRDMRNTIIALLNIKNTNNFESHLSSLPLSAAKKWGEELARAQDTLEIYKNPKKGGFSSFKAMRRKRQAGKQLKTHAANMNRIKNMVNVTFNTETGRVHSAMQKQALAYGRAKKAYIDANPNKTSNVKLEELRIKLENAESELQKAAIEYVRLPQRPAPNIEDARNALNEKADKLREKPNNLSEKDRRQLELTLQVDAKRLFEKIGSDKKRFAQLCPKIKPNGTLK